MRTTTRQITTYWLDYLHAEGVDPESKSEPEAWRFGDSAEMADELGQLVLYGSKTATSSLYKEYELSGEVLPAVGDQSILLDGNNRPICIIETTEVRRLRFNEVDESFAFDEGEADRSLRSWRDGHRRFFSRQADRLGIQFSDAMFVICERFRVVYESEAPALSTQ